MGALSLLPSKLKIVVFVFLGIVLFYIVGLIGAAVCNFMWMDWVEFFKYLDGNLHRNYALLCVGGLFALCAVVAYAVALILKKFCGCDCIAKIICLAAFVVFIIAFCCQCFMVSRTSNDSNKCVSKYTEDSSTVSMDKYAKATIDHPETYEKFGENADKICGYIFKRCLAFVIIEGIGLLGLIILFIIVKILDLPIDEATKVFFK